MSPKKLENYAYLWDKVSLYLIAPSAYPIENPQFEEDNFVIYRRFAFDLVAVDIAKEFKKPVAQLMKDAGVELRSKPINWKEEFKIERLWTDKVHEFAIVEISRPRRQYDIVHEQLQESVVLPDNYTSKDLDNIALKMIERGAKLVKKS